MIRSLTFYIFSQWHISSSLAYFFFFFFSVSFCSFIVPPPPFLSPFIFAYAFSSSFDALLCYIFFFFLYLLLDANPKSKKEFERLCGMAKAANALYSITDVDSITHTLSVFLPPRSLASSKDKDNQPIQRREEEKKNGINQNEHNKKCYKYIIRLNLIARIAIDISVRISF